MTKFAHYRAFKTVVEANGMSSAARVLNISPPAISKQISMLEQDLGVQLIDRSNRKIKITEPGRKFYTQCRDILARIADTEKSLNLQKQDISGKISLTMPKSLTRSPILKALFEFSTINPSIKFNIELSEEIKDLYESESDFAFRLGKIESSTRLVAIPLFEVKLVFCASTRYLDLHGKPTSFNELENHNLILLSPYSYSEVMRKFIKRKNINLNLNNNHTSNEIEVVYQSVFSHQAIGILLDVNIKQELMKNEVVDIFSHENLPRKTLSLVFKKSGLISKKHDAFKNFIKKELTL